MGCAASTAAASQPSATATSGSKRKAALRERRATRDAKLQNFRAIPDQFQTLEQVTQEIRAAGLESSQLIIGVDFTKSNLWTGQNSFKGHAPYRAPLGYKPLSCARSMLLQGAFFCRYKCTDTIHNTALKFSVAFRPALTCSS